MRDTTAAIEAAYNTAVDRLERSANALRRAPDGDPSEPDLRADYQAASREADQLKEQLEDRQAHQRAVSQHRAVPLSTGGIGRFSIDEPDTYVRAAAVS